MKSWQLLLLLFLTHYGTVFVKNQWDAFTSMLGLLCAFLLWYQRGRRWTMIWLVSMWGIAESLQVFVCQAINATASVKTEQYEGVCEKLTGLPLSTLGLMCVAALAALWLDRQKT